MVFGLGHFGIVSKSGFANFIAEILELDFKIQCRGWDMKGIIFLLGIK